MIRVMRWLLLGFVALIVFGCVPLRDRAVASMNGVSKFSDVAIEDLDSRYEGELKRCVDRSDTKPKALACGRDVDERFDPVYRAHRTVRAVWLLLAATIHAADADASDLDELEVLRLLTQLSDAVRAFKAALQKGSP